MNSIDDADVEAMLGTLFDQLLMPIAESMRAEGREAFPRKPDVSWLSYYVRRRRSVMTAADFASVACADGAEFVQRLQAHWQHLGRDELVAVAPQFGAAAEALRLARQPGAPSAEPSPFVYAMF
ncbi:MAG: hypothetical protein V4723_11515 [Pseudomonadota bacterium]